MNEDLGEILLFKYPEDMKKGKIIVQKDHPSEDPYIKKWTVADPQPDQATIDTWRGEFTAHKANEAAQESNRAAAENRLRNPMPTTSIPALREMVDDILTYLKLDV
jgi:hypothetical protein